MAEHIVIRSPALEGRFGELFDKAAKGGMTINDLKKEPEELYHSEMRRLPDGILNNPDITYNPLVKDAYDLFEECTPKKLGGKSPITEEDVQLYADLLLGRKPYTTQMFADSAEVKVIYEDYNGGGNGRQIAADIEKAAGSAPPHIK